MSTLEMLKALLERETNPWAVINLEILIAQETENERGKRIS